ncbi:MAG: terpene cyclase/mutase family protein [Mariniblastus sp.]|nr:terpene cyclase/mutase family protein [Mariniblastus sp.]
MTKQPNSNGSSLPNDGSSLGAFKTGAAAPRHSKDQPPPARQGKKRELETVKPRSRRRPGGQQNNPLVANLLTRMAQKDAEAASEKQRVAEESSKPSRHQRTSPLVGLLESPPIDEVLLSQSLRQIVLEQDLDEEGTLLDATASKRMIPVPSFLVSMVVHLAIFLTLALVVYTKTAPEPKLSLIAAFELMPTPMEPSEVEIPETMEIELPDDSQSPLEKAFDASATEDKLELADTTDIVPNIATDAIEPSPIDSEVKIAPKATLPSGGGLEGREESSRARLAASRGGSRASELAVENGIRWIINHQRKDGSWHFRHDDGQCNGACRNQGLQESTTAATGLAMMTLLGAGYTQNTGPYQEEVHKAIEFLKRKIRIGPHGGSFVQGQSGMYSHAIATIALAEAYIMTRDTGLSAMVDLGRQYIETAQHKQGGWRYVPGTKGDMTVTGWQIIALKSCERAGFESGEVTWERAEDFLDSLASSDGRYGYQNPDNQTDTTTAVGMLSKMYLGAALEDGRQELGAQFLVGQGPSRTDMYFNYYATLALHHRQDPDWNKWNTQLRDYLIQTQVNGNGHADGSWYFADQHGKVGGRLYTTALAVMTLEVYYRYMPLYANKGL